MRGDRFRAYVIEQLSARPEIASVTEIHTKVEGERPDLRVETVDGTVFTLRAVRSSPPGGEDFSQPEKIVTKDGLTKTGS